MDEIVEFFKSDIETNLKIKEKLIELRKQNISTQAKRAEELTANLIVCGKAIKMMGDEIFDMGVENKTLREKLGNVDEKWLSEEKVIDEQSYTDEEKIEFFCRAHL